MKLRNVNVFKDINDLMMTYHDHWLFTGYDGEYVISLAVDWQGGYGGFSQAWKWLSLLCVNRKF